jgi:hypothetical protein
MSTFIYTFYYLDYFKKLLESDTQLDPENLIIYLKSIFINIKSNNINATELSFIEFYTNIFSIIPELDYNQMNDIDDLYNAFMTLIPENYSNIFKIKAEYDDLDQDNQVIKIEYDGYEVYEYILSNPTLSIIQYPGILKLKYQYGQGRIYNSHNPLKLFDYVYIIKSLVLYTGNHYYCIVRDNKKYYKYDGLNSNRITIQENVFNEIVKSGNENGNAYIVSIFYELKTSEKNTNKGNKPTFTKKKN